jgi:hypothetical protein
MQNPIRSIPIALTILTVISGMLSWLVPAARSAGAQDTAAGTGALAADTSGNYNTADGYEALFGNTTGLYNTGLGAQALLSNTSGTENAATGINALFENTTGSYNTANGAGALYHNTIGNDNTGFGYQALFSNTAGGSVTGLGYKALYNNTLGFNNVAAGDGALNGNTTGDYNVAVGYQTLSGNTTASNNIALGNVGNSGDNSTIYIGTQGTQTQTNIAGIYGTTISGATVTINSSGQLGTMTSSSRFKDNIQDMSATSAALYALRPVTYHYKPQLDPQGVAQYGLVAEEVEKVNPALVVHDPDGQPHSVRYEAVNAMLLNEFLKEPAKVRAQEARMQGQDVAIARLEAEVKEQSALLQKVSARLAAVIPATPRLAVNNER